MTEIQIISPVPDGPTRYRISEESGVKMDLHTTQTTTALLCNANGVDTQETKSLCCAAAGITASISATAEALIPHEKLREAATPDATLIAQNRPPAQPDFGYKPSLVPSARLLVLIFRSAVVGNTRQFSSVPIETRDCLSGVRESVATKFKLFNIALTAVPGSFETFFYTFCCIQSFRDVLLNDKNRAKGAIRKRSTQKAPQRVPYLFQSSQTNHIGRTNCESCSLIDRGVCLIRCIFREMKGIDFKLGSFIRLCLSLQLMRTLSNKESTHNCSYRTKSLNPSRRVLLNIKSIEQYKQSPPQNADSQKQPHHTNRGHAHDRWKLQPFHTFWSFAVRRAARLPTFVTSVHGGQA